MLSEVQQKGRQQRTATIVNYLPTSYLNPRSRRRHYKSTLPDVGSNPNLAGPAKEDSQWRNRSPCMFWPLMMAVVERGR